MTEADLRQKVLKLFKESSNNADQDSDEKFPRLRASQFISGDFLPLHDIDLPPGYFLWENGLYKASVGEGKDESIVIKKLTLVPFFVAFKDEHTKVLLLRFLRPKWLQEWISSKKIFSKSAFQKMLISPEKGATFAEITEYTHMCAIEAPFAEQGDSSSTPAIIEAVNLIREKYGLTKSEQYPIEISVPELKKICEDFKVSYFALRKHLLSTETIRKSSKVNKIAEKATRFLVFDKAL